MKVELIESVDEFISTTTAFRATDPLRTNVIGSVALSVAEGDRSYDDYRWWIVRSDDGDVAGVAMRTSPFNMVVAPMSLDAARALGRSVGQFDDALPGISGSRDIVDALIEDTSSRRAPARRAQGMNDVVTSSMSWKNWLRPKSRVLGDQRGTMKLNRWP